MRRTGKTLAFVMSVALVFSSFGTAFAEEVSSGEIGSFDEAGNPAETNSELPDSGEAKHDSSDSVESNASTQDASGVESNDAPKLNEIEKPRLKENSWRYANGEPIKESAPWAYYRTAVPAWSWTPDGYVSSNGSIIQGAKLKGIDVSEHQGTIDWEAVKRSGVDFAIIRCGYGDNYQSQDDAQWARNVSECERLGIPYGVYIYSYATDISMANSEADHVLRLLKGHNPTYPVYYDLEESKLESAANRDLLARMAETFCGKISAAGFEPGVYANLNWWNNYLTDPVFNSWTRWVAQYNYQCDYRGSYQMWQCTSAGKVDGIAGGVDINFAIDSSGSIEDDFGIPTTPYPTPISAGEYTISSMLDQTKVLDVNESSMLSGGNVQLYSSNMTNAQKFNLSFDEATGYYTIKNTNSGLVLGLHKFGGQYQSNVAQYPADENDRSQKWIVEGNGDGSYTIVSALNPSYVLDVAGSSIQNGANIQVYKANNSLAQRFGFNPTRITVPGGKTLPDGVYVVRSSLDRGKVVDVAGSSLLDGGNVQLYAYNGSAAQKYSIEYDGSGFYSVKCLRSGKAMQSLNGNLSSGTNVCQWAFDASRDDEKWAISRNSDGTYTFVCKANGLALDVASGSTADGTNIQSWKQNGSPAQKFFVESAAAERTVADGTYYMQSGLAKGMVVDIDSSGKGDGVNAQLYSFNGSAAQKFKVSYDGSTGFYAIVNANSGKPLDVSGSRMADGTNVAQYSNNGTLAQRWIISRDANGAFKVASAINPNYVLDIASSSTENGANVQIYRSNDTLAQRFHFEAV